MWFAGMNAGLVICLCAQLLPVFVFFKKKKKSKCWQGGFAGTTDDRRVVLLLFQSQRKEAAVNVQWQMDKVNRRGSCFASLRSTRHVLFHGPSSLALARPSATPPLRQQRGGATGKATQGQAPDMTYVNAPRAQPREREGTMSWAPGLQAPARNPSHTGETNGEVQVTATRQRQPRPAGSYSINDVAPSC